MNNTNTSDNNNWAIAIFFISLTFYWITMARTVIWGDSAGFALMVERFLLDPAADGHPLYIILGKLFSFLPGELAVNLNFMSAFFAAISVALVYLVTIEFCDDKIAGALGAGALTFSHAFWLHAVTTEVYTINTCFVLGVIYFLLRWKNQRRNYLLYWGAFIYGLSLSHHMVIGLLGIAILYFLFMYDYKIFTDKRILIILACFLLGFSVYLGVLLHWMITMPEKTTEITDIATGRGHKEYMLNLNIKWITENIVMYLAYLFYQFPLVGFCFGTVGIIKFFQDNRKLTIFFLLAIIINAGFFILGPRTWGSPNYTFYIQDYAIFSLMIAYSCHCLIKKKGEKIIGMLLMALLLTPFFTYQITPVIIKGLGMDILHARQLPFRDNETFFLNPNKFGYKGPKKYAYTALGQLESGATIIADYTPATVLEYYKEIIGLRPDVKLVYVQEASNASEGYDLKPYVDENYENGPIYLADLAGKGYYNTVNLEKEYSLEPHKPIYKIKRTETATDIK